MISYHTKLWYSLVCCKDVDIFFIYYVNGFLREYVRMFKRLKIVLLKNCTHEIVHNFQMIIN